MSDKCEACGRHDAIWRVDNGVTIHLACGQDIGDFTLDGSLNIVTVWEPEPSNMSCEAHPRRLWPHGDCIGPGMPIRSSFHAGEVPADE